MCSQVMLGLYVSFVGNFDLDAYVCLAKGVLEPEQVFRHFNTRCYFSIQVFWAHTRLTLCVPMDLIMIFKQGFLPCK